MSEVLSNSPTSNAERDAHRALVGRARATIGALEGVISVGFGQKHTAGSYLALVAISVYVRQKKPTDTIAPEQRIPAEFEGMPTDVRVIADGAQAGCNNSQPYNPVEGGIQIVAGINTPGDTFYKGTLGCMVRKRGQTGREDVYLLTCKHVLYSNGSKAGNIVYHPFAPLPSGKYPGGPDKDLGTIDAKAYEGNVLWAMPGTGSPRMYHLDCATARIHIDCICWGSHCTKDDIKYTPTIADLDLGTDDPATPLHENRAIADVRNVDDDSSIIGKTVYKVGRSTGKTAGIVRSVATALRIRSDSNDSSSALVIAQMLLEIDFDIASTPSQTNCLNNQRFVEEGDSGAVVVDENRNVIGIVAIGPPKYADALTPPKKWAAWACHILPVLDNLGICVLTTGGSSYGSCAATDGSGLIRQAPAPPVAGTPGGFDFAGMTLRQSTASGVEAPASPRITEDERRRMLGARRARRNAAWSRAA